MKIMFDDLTKEAQMRLLGEVGVDDPEEMGWDVKPVAVVIFEEDDHWNYDDDDEDDDEDEDKDEDEEVDEDDDDDDDDDDDYVDYGYEDEDDDR